MNRDTITEADNLNTTGRPEPVPEFALARAAVTAELEELLAELIENYTSEK